MNHDERHRYEQAYFAKRRDRACGCSMHRAARRPRHQCYYCGRFFDPLAVSEGYVMDGEGRIRCKNCTGDSDA